MIRVTQVLNLFMNLWKVPEDVLARKCALGTEVHEAILNVMYAQTEPVSSYAVSDEALPYLESFQKWVQDKDFAIHLWEERFNSDKMGLTGQVDAVLELGGKKHLFDWKTSAQDDPVCWRLQGTAYVHLLRENGEDVDDIFYFIKLRKDGKKADTFAYQYTNNSMQIFMKAMDCLHYFQEWKGDLPAG